MTSLETPPNNNDVSEQQPITRETHLLQEVLRTSLSGQRYMSEDAAVDFILGSHQTKPESKED